MDLKKNLDIKARNSLKRPFSYQHGYIYDANGDVVSDEHGSRIRGWGRLQGDAELQDAIGERIAKILTEHWND